MPRTLPALVLAALAFLWPARALAIPHIAGQTAITNVPGRIISWQDSVYFSVGRDTLNAQVLHRVNVKTGARKDYPVGARGRGEVLGFSPDGRTLLATERDSTRALHLEEATVPQMAWRTLFPVSDPDPHVSWFADGASFLYQDILDDSVGTPSVFKYVLRSPLPRLFMFGCQRPLVAPTGDAIVCIGADTLNPGPTRDLEQKQPVGLEDLTAGEFRWVAPFRTWVPTSGGWSPDGARVALVGYALDASGAPERRLYIYSRIINDKTVVPLAEEGRSGTQHDADMAVWSPHGTWIAVGLLPGRGGGVQGTGGVWLVSPGGNEAFQLNPTTGTWRGAPLWVGDHTLLIADAGTAPEAPVPGKYWLVEFEEE